MYACYFLKKALHCIFNMQCYNIAVNLYCYLHILNKQKPMHYFHSLLNMENVRCAVAIDNEYDGVLTMTQESRYA